MEQNHDVDILTYAYKQAFEISRCVQDKNDVKHFENPDWGISNEDSHRLLILCKTRERCNNLNNVYLAPSTRHGKGVFTSAHIKKGQVLTYYPADYITIQHQKHTFPLLQ